MNALIAMNRTVYSRRVVAFDLDRDSMVSVREALPGWNVEVVNGSATTTIAHDWNPDGADLLIVNAREDVAETLGLCRFLVFCGGFSKDFRAAPAETMARLKSRKRQARRIDAPLLVLVKPGQKKLVEAALGVGAHSCLTLPIHAKDVASMWVRARAGNQPGRHTLDLERAQNEDLWRDDGGQG